jgi:N12 class adenine-specific DNA methylase
MDDAAEPTGSITLGRRGMAALELIHTLPDDTTPETLTAEQRATLSGWGGWGPLAKALDYGGGQPWEEFRTRLFQLLGYGGAMDTARNACDTAFYTPRTVVRAMWDLVAALGFKGGKAAELGCGSGRFITATPPGVDVEWTGIEADKTLAPGGTQAVTDIVVFRRGRGERQLDDRWQLPGTKPEGLDTTISQYFQAHPEFVLGAMANRAGAQFGQVLAVTLPDGDDLAVRLDDAAQTLAATVTHAGLSWQPRSAPPGPETPDAGDGPDPACDGAYTLHGDGQVTQQRDGRHHPVRADPELVALIRLKTAAVSLFAAEADEQMGDNARNRIRQDAFRRYQEYTAVYGYLGRSDLTTRPDPDDPGSVIVVRARPTRMGGFRDDPDWPTVLAVEVWDDETGVGKPAPILTRHVNARPRRKDHTDDPGEALLLTLDECGQVDLQVAARILGVDEGDVPALLGDQIWQDPADPQAWVTADEYLSGNVRAKLAQAKAAAEDDDRWAGHVAALEAVQPEDLTPDLISVQLGAPWLPPETVHEFVCDLLQVGRYNADRVEVRYEPYTATWEVRASTDVRRLPLALTWGTTRRNAVNLIEDASNNTAPTIYDTVDLGEGEKQVKNRPETALCADKIRDIQERFAEWAWEDPKRADALARIYNDRFNNTKVRTFDGSLLTFPGLTMPPGRTMYASQVDMVWRNVCTGTTLCGHVVGAGKTLIAAATAMTLRRLGLARKPLMVVPNHLLEQTCAEVRRYYPGSQILMVTREDLNPQRRRFFAAKCAARDWDLVVATHQQFGSMPVAPEIQEEYFCDLMDELDGAMEDIASESRGTAKMLARKRKKLLAKLDALADTAKDGGLTFEQTGIDYLIVDEAHAFKNLEFVARAEGFNTAGSKRADDMLMKTAWLRKTSPDGRVGMLMTGTPVSNALSELHVLFRYCVPELLDEMGLTSFDSFAAQFIRYQTTTEVAPDGGGFRSYRRPRMFVNLQELRAMLWQFADIRTRNDLSLDGPDVRVHHVVVDGPPELGPFTATLVERADKIRNGGVKPKEDNMLNVCGAGRAAALWLPLVGITPTGPGKVERCAAQVAKIYHDTKDQLYPDPAGAELHHPRPGAFQVVFCDLGTPNENRGASVYDYLRDLLAHQGVPAKRIVFIHDVKSHPARAALFARCRSGEVSVLIGSTEKMGTGVNIQRRMAAIHELDHPWRPADVEQRHGRGDRPGNDNPQLGIYRYATKGSFDAYTLQGLERKKRFIDQVLSGDPHIREVEAVDNPQVLSYAELKALATGQPLLMMLSEVNSTIARLRNSSAGHKRAQARMASEQAEAKASAKRWTEAADQLRSIARRAEAAARDGDPVLIPDDGGKFTGGEDAGIEVGVRLAAARRDRDTTVKLGRWRGCYLTVDLGYRKNGAPHLTGEIRSTYYEKHGHPVTLAGNVWMPKTGGALILAQLDEAIDDAEGRAQACQGRAEEALDRAAQLTPHLGDTWGGKDELAEALKRRAEVEAEIDAQVKDSRPAPEPAPV